MADLREVLAAIDAQILQIRRIVEETKASIEALESLQSTDEMLVPLGAGVLVSAKFEGKVLVDVGGGVVLESPLEKVLERLRKRIENAEKEIERLRKERERLLSQARGEG